MTDQHLGQLIRNSSNAVRRMSGTPMNKCRSLFIMVAAIVLVSLMAQPVAAHPLDGISPGERFERSEALSGQPGTSQQQLQPTEIEVWTSEYQERCSLIPQEVDQPSDNPSANYFSARCQVSDGKEQPFSLEQPDLDLPPAPRLVSPANNNQVNTLIPVMRVDSVISGTPLSVWMIYSRDPSFGSFDGWIKMCGSTNRYWDFYFYFSNLRPGTQYYWRASTAYGNACQSGTWGPYSATWSFTTTSNGTVLNGPQLIAPPNGSDVYTRRPTFSWQALPDRKGFQLWGRPDGWNGYGFLALVWNDPSATWSVGWDLELARRYSWYVKVRNDYAWGNPSTSWRFTIRTPSSISGRVIGGDNNGLCGVTISDGAGHNTTTGSDGRYSLAGLPTGTYTIRASKTGYVFSPPSRSVTVPPNASGVDFTGVGAYQVSGRVTDSGGVGIAGTTVSAGTGQVITDINGNYIITRLESGSFTVTPSKSGYTFCPRSRTTAVPPNQTGRNFTGSLSGVDLDFCPEPNGFGFPNKQIARKRAMFLQYFGPENVLEPNQTTWCTGAEDYFRTRYEHVAEDYSCAGFSLASLLSYQNRPQPYAGSYAMPHYEHLSDEPVSLQLDSSIAFYSGVQASKQFKDETAEWFDSTCAINPTDMVDRAKRGIQSGSPEIIGLQFAPRKWHALIPYRVVQVSADLVHMYVYDSEAPRQERIVRFVRQGNGWQWAYSFTGSVGNISETGLCRDMYYLPLSRSTQKGIPPFNFCADSGSNSPTHPSLAGNTDRLLTVSPSSGDWIIRDTSGNRLGWIDDTMVSEIPDASVWPELLGDLQSTNRSLYLPEASYAIEASTDAAGGLDYWLFVDGGNLKMKAEMLPLHATNVTTVSAGLDNITVSQPDDMFSLKVDATRELPGVSRTASLSGSAISSSDGLDISFDGEQMKLSRANGSLQYRVQFFQPGTASGNFITEPVTLNADEAHTLRPSSWTGLSASTVVLEIDEGRNGTIDETVMLENTVRSIFLPTVPGS